MMNTSLRNSTYLLRYLDGLGKIRVVCCNTVVLATMSGIKLLVYPS